MQHVQRILLGLCIAAGVAHGTAQVLARPGWAGSGVAPEAWWRRAVFYRIDPPRFQDSDGDGTGDLAGVTQRLDYLQSLGVDALLLDGSFPAEDLEDLVRAASQHHLRVLVTLPAAAAQGPRPALLNTVHGWLSAGVAGLALPAAGPGNPSGSAALVTSLQALLRSFPGERILLVDGVPAAPIPVVPAPVGPAPLRRGRHRLAGAGTAAPQAGLLVAAPGFPAGSADAAPLRAMLSAATLGTGPDTNTLLRFATDPPTGSPNALAFASMLLASRGAAVFDFGDELGLDLQAAAPLPGTTTPKNPPVMRWTPSNHTPAPAPDTTGTARPATPETEFGAYHPYQPPPRSLTGVLPSATRVTVDANIPVAPPDADTLPGFTAAALPPAPRDVAQRNVVTEDRDTASLLNAYRALIALHHGNATLRNGTQVVLNRDAEGALVWVRRAPAGSRTVANVVAAANLSDRPVTLALDSDLEALGMRPGALRPLLAFPVTALTGESTARLVLPPHAVYLGEIFHAGSLPEAPAREHTGRRARRRTGR